MSSPDLARQVVHVDFLALLASKSGSFTTLTEPVRALLWQQRLEEQIVRDMQQQQTSNYLLSLFISFL
ncbi:MAG: hypothetical protein E6Q06_01955 [Candidatus Moraniibacteriota bacterium]|nr:MAG: hypothetical protein E6Q06_01955 [Candidatus Moranbacteria bacterium]